MHNYVFYGIDTETTGLDPVKNDIIELSIYRLSDDVQRTWFLKPINFDNIEIAALRVNHHKLEDLRGQTQYGRDTYQDPKQAIVEIENWLFEDNVDTANRCLIGHNAGFDKAMMESLWFKCQASDSFPFGRRFIDTMVLELAMDYAGGEYAEGYSLNNLAKKYSVKNERAHSAAADTKCMVEVFRKQANCLKRLF
jgi:DNA polymerase III epsilon subunit-like protein